MDTVKNAFWTGISQKTVCLYVWFPKGIYLGPSHILTFIWLQHFLWQYLHGGKLKTTYINKASEKQAKYDVTAFYIIET